MALREDILAPIPGDNPSGEDLRYAPIVAQIKEARREEEDIAQGVWATERKVADWAQVVKLASEAIAKKSKDLQLAVWLTEALTRREGLEGFREGITLTADLMEQFWDTLWPELEDGDAELRSVPVAWLATQIDASLRRVPLIASGVSHLKYKESLTVPNEEDAGRDPDKAERRKLAIDDGKLTPEDLQSALNATSTAMIEERMASLAAAREALDRLDSLCNEKLGEYAPTFEPIRQLMDELKLSLRQLQQRKGEGAKPAASAQAQQEPSRQVASEPEPASRQSSSSSGGGGADWLTAYQPVTYVPESEPQYEPQPEPSPAAAPESSSGSTWGSSWDTAYQEPAAASAPPPPAAAPAATYAATPEPQDAEDLAARLSVLAGWLRKQDPRSPAPYLMLRGFRWGELRGLGGQLDPEWLEAPSTETRQKIRRLAQQEEWQELLEATEQAMAQPCGRAWLDLQRYALAACEGLGEEYAGVAAAIVNATRGLLQDYPQLLEAVLSDDTPAANAQTREALAQHGCLPGEKPAPKAAAPSERSDDSLIDDALRRGRHDLALETVARRMSQETSGRGRFQRRVQSARILEAAGRKQAAIPLLRELASEISQRRLEDWETPAIIVEPLCLLYRCLAAVSDSEEERRSIYNQICRLDPVKALDLT
ncbi:MAG: type VI secretion system protein TssA [Bryobacteraceae bacterium]|nr:type VI secretion system protein TssA [Bryobacteraceae bacterium]